MVIQLDKQTRLKFAVFKAFTNERPLNPPPITIICFFYHISERWGLILAYGLGL